jgi:cyanophycin synthetase
MRILEQRILRGPNLWAEQPCLQTLIDFSDAALLPSQAIQDLLPDGAAAGSMPKTVAQLASALQRMVGASLNFAMASPMATLKNWPVRRCSLRST